MHRRSESVLAIAFRHDIRSLLHLWTGIAHGDAEPGARKHRDIVAAVADDRDFRRRNGQQLRELGEGVTLVGARTRDIEIIRLRAHDRRLSTQGDPQIRLALDERLRVLAHPDDLGDVEDIFEARDHGRPEFYGALLMLDIWRVGVAN